VLEIFVESEKFSIKRVFGQNLGVFKESFVNDFKEIGYLGAVLYLGY
jgi:hypothetical protein